MFANSAQTRQLLLGDSELPVSDHLALPSWIFDPDTYNLVTSIPPPHPFFAPLGLSIFNCASLVQCFLVSDCLYDPFDPLDWSSGPGLSFPIPRFYCFATLMFFAERHPQPRSKLSSLISAHYANLYASIKRLIPFHF